jgi:hypothetical protein
MTLASWQGMMAKLARSYGKAQVALLVHCLAKCLFWRESRDSQDT